MFSKAINDIIGAVIIGGILLLIIYIFRVFYFKALDKYYDIKIKELENKKT